MQHSEEEAGAAGLFLTSGLCWLAGTLQGVLPQTPVFFTLSLCFPPVFTPPWPPACSPHIPGCAPLTPMEGQTTAPKNRQSGSSLLSLFSVPPAPPPAVSLPRHVTQKQGKKKGLRRLGRAGQTRDTAN